MLFLGLNVIVAKGCFDRSNRSYVIHQSLFLAGIF